MQNYREILDTDDLAASRTYLLDTDKTAISLNAGTAFPTLNLLVGMLCYRSDEDKIYQLKSTGPDVWEILPSKDSPSFTGNTSVVGFTETVYVMTGTIIDPINGTIQTKTMTSNTTFTEVLTDGQSLTLLLTGGDLYTVTWPTVSWVKAKLSEAPVLTASDYLVFWKISGILYGAYVGTSIA